MRTGNPGLIGQKSPADSLFLSSWESVQRQAAAVRMFLRFFRLRIFAFEVGEGHVQRFAGEAEVQQNTCKARSSAWDLVSFRRTGEEP